MLLTALRTLKNKVSISITKLTLAFLNWELKMCYSIQTSQENKYNNIDEMHKVRLAQYDEKVALDKKDLQAHLDIEKIELQRSINSTEGRIASLKQQIQFLNNV